MNAFTAAHPATPKVTLIRVAAEKQCPCGCPGKVAHTFLLDQEAWEAAHEAGHVDCSMAVDHVTVLWGSQEHLMAVKNSGNAS